MPGRYLLGLHLYQNYYVLFLCTDSYRLTFGSWALFQNNLAVERKMQAWPWVHVLVFGSDGQLRSLFACRIEGLWLGKSSLEVLLGDAYRLA